ncbi:extracellular solute-binding protein [Actinopolymorpha singaporensis]|uniref:Multiple sugar transport system substrate-binding protein n=1 Tax=Actinopolymorpha singaporensis TaxID=117157 RepID=A0A1H1RD04_9ACTN|nr:extracellular solute-binding protein [Actinopolymorpha singaporensis]SDS33416.1 multiple sugar transport system substrate-binding protein [Actinopolymorpha singaporensis]
MVNRMVNRRKFLAASGGALLGAAGLGACNTAPSTTERSSGSSGGGGGGRGRTLRWWDHFQPRADLHEKIFAEFEKSTGVHVEYTVYNPNKQGQALQLAFSSKQMPDVFTTAGLGVPAARLRKQGWFAPIDLDEKALAAIPKSAFLEGFTHYGGKLYSLPLVSFRQYTTLTWFNTDLMKKAGADPARDVTTWDGVRKTARAIKRTGGGAYGWIAPLQFAPRMGEHVEDLAQAAGGVGSVDPRTGEYTYGSDAFVHAIEFLASMKRDGVLFPASSSLDARTARARWTTGIAGVFFDGPWNVGVVNDGFKQFLDKLDVAPVPVAEAGRAPVLYSAPKAGDFWLSASSEVAGKASELLGRFATEDVMLREAEQMDAMPVDLGLVDKANVHPTFKQAAEFYRRQVRLAPSPVARNAAVSDVIAEMKPIDPNLGTLVQGALGGQVKDIRKALTEYAGKLTAERARAIKVVAGKGAEVSEDDWKFDDWKPGEDYGTHKYGSS